MIEVVQETRLPADALWPFLADVRRWPEWLPTVTAVRPVQPDRPDEVGASYVLDQPGLPRATWTITQWHPDRAFSWESRAVGVVSTGIHELRPGRSGTTIRLALSWSGPAAPLIRILLGRKGRAYVAREARALEEVGAAGSGRS